MQLSGDIGGTKTTLGLSNPGQPGQFERYKTYLNSQFNSFEEVLRNFLGETSIDLMVLGVAAPITARRAELTNSDWTIDADAIEAEYHTIVYLLNDLEAAAYGINHLNSSDIVKLHFGESTSSPEILVAIGTGIGMAQIDTKKELVSPSEGGHIGFSPKTEFQMEFMRFIQQRQNHVSYEMVVSSIGFKFLQKFILTTNYFSFSPEFISEMKNTPNFSELIYRTSKMLSDDSKMCQMILDEFSSVVGSYLGDLALVYLPHSIYLTGGIGQNVLNTKVLLRFYLQKGKMSKTVHRSSLFLIRDPLLGIKGSAWYGINFLSK